MSHYEIGKSITKHEILARKGKDKISMVTCYDAAFGRIIEKSSIDCVLVGDSVGNVVLGFEDTLSVTMNDIILHTAAVSRVIKRPMLIADMPFGSYQTSKKDSVSNAIRLVQEGHAQAVKLEGGDSVRKKVAAIVAAGVPVVGHLGFTPQSINAIGGYRVQGRGEQVAQSLIAEARALQDAGCFMLVLEMVPASLASRITEELDIPTIGIGAGSACDGQVLVIHDLLGFDNDFAPKFLKKYANLNGVISEALDLYDKDVKTGVYPTDQHSYAD